MCDLSIVGAYRIVCEIVLGSPSSSSPLVGVLRVEV